MGTDKRARQKELGRTRAEQARQAAEAAARRRRLTRTAGISIILVVVIGVVVYLTGDDGKTVSAKSSSKTSTTKPADSTTTTEAYSNLPAATLKGPGAGATISGDTPCPKADGSSPRTTTFAKAPPTCTDAKKIYLAEFSTSKGDFVVTLDAKSAPKTVNNFVVLSRYHFYDGIEFHRIVPGFMFQGGDPSDPPSGSGGPGYQFADELPKQGAYEIGSIAMANSGANTNGSQFFVVTGETGVSLSPNYSLFGKVTSGIDVMNAIASVPRAKSESNDGAPTEAVTIKSVKITET